MVKTVHVILKVVAKVKKSRKVVVRKVRIFF